jgi:uncharacterized membrane protein
MIKLFATLAVLTAIALGASPAQAQTSSRLEEESKARIIKSIVVGVAVSGIATFASVRKQKKANSASDSNTEK